MKITEEDVYVSNSSLIHEACRRFRKGMEYDDCFLAASEGFIYAMRNYQPGISEFRTYAMTIMREQIDQEQKELNRIRSIESTLSLDRPVKGEENAATIGTTFFPHTCDFMNRLLLSDFLNHLKEEQRSIAWMYIDRYTSQEILNILGISPTELSRLLKLIRDLWNRYDGEYRAA